MAMSISGFYLIYLWNFLFKYSQTSVPISILISVLYSRKNKHIEKHK